MTPSRFQPPKWLTVMYQLTTGVTWGSLIGSAFHTLFGNPATADFALIAGTLMFLLSCCFRQQIEILHLEHKLEAKQQEQE